MGLAAILRSSDFAAITLWLTVYLVFNTLCSCTLTNLVPLTAVLYHLYQILSPKTIPGGDKWNVIIIGAGMSGLNTAKKLKEAGVPFTILEKAPQLGGTWWFNQYPGAACDVASHLYSLSSYLNPWWSRAYSPYDEIENYLFDFAKEFDLVRHINFNQKVSSAVWDEKNQKWMITTESGKKYEAHFVISCIGALHAPAKPNFKDQDKFKGRIVHTAEWTPDVNLKGKRVAVIGTGASAVQVVPNIVKDVKELHVFQRSAAWVPARGSYDFPSWLKQIFAVFPPLMILLRWFIFWRGEIRFMAIFHKDRKWISGILEKLVKKDMENAIKDQALAKKLIPDYPMGCKRITPSDTYLQSFNLSHVHLVTDDIESYTPDGIRAGGKNYDIDVIILATGFSVMDSAKSVRCTGKNGQVLQDVWKDEPRLYKGTSFPGFPNLFFLLGPGTGLGHNSVIYVIECQTNHAIDALTKLIQSGHKSMDCKPEKLEEYRNLTERLMKDRVFRGGGGCTAWYLNQRGINWTLWPGNLTHFWWMTLTCAFDDYIVR